MAVEVEALEQVVRADLKVPARCTTCSYEWDAIPQVIARGGGCPECGKLKSAQKRSLGKSEIRERFDRVGLELIGEPTNSKGKVAARCRACGHEWGARPDVVAVGGGCPKCGVRRRSKARLVGDEEIADRERIANVRWLYPVTRVNDPVEAECLTCGHIWPFRPNSVGKTGCPNCAGQVVTQADWEVRFDSVGLELVDEVVSSKKKVKARCRRCRAEVKITPNMASQGKGCRTCGIDRRAKANRISEEEIASREERANVRWLDRPVAAHDPQDAECLTCGHVWPYKPVNVGRSGCPRCAGLIVTQDEWQARAAIAGYVLLDEVEGRSKPVTAKCSLCGEQWRVWTSNIGRSGCPSCAPRGFNPSKPGYVYLISKDDGVAKVGVAGLGKPYEDRMRRHATNGYWHVRRWYCDPGRIALAVERETIRRWREEDRLPTAAPEGEDGYSETVSTARLPLSEIVRRIDELVG